MKSKLKMELLNSEVENQVQGGAGGFASNALIALNSANVVTQSGSYSIGGIPTGWERCALIEIKNCWQIEVRPCCVIECTDRKAV